MSKRPKSPSPRFPQHSQKQFRLQSLSPAARASVKEGLKDSVSLEQNDLTQLEIDDLIRRAEFKESDKPG